MLTANEMDITSDMIYILKPFKEANENISGETFVTVSLTIPLAHLIRQKLEKMEVNTKEGQTAKNIIILCATDRLNPQEKSKFFAKSTVLDPRFKKF